jgi:excisionase family DNA binding protein
MGAKIKRRVLPNHNVRLKGVNMQDIYNAKQVANMLGISRDGVYRLIRAGRLKARKLSARRIRVTEADLSLFIKTNRLNDGGQSCTTE